MDILNFRTSFDNLMGKKNYKVSGTKKDGKYF
jgi:hypothetical protein